MNKQYRMIEPVGGGDFQQQLNECLQQLIDKHQAGCHIFKISVFVDADQDDAWEKCREIVNHTLVGYFAEQCPAFSVIAQAPRNQLKVSLEIGSVCGHDVVLEYKQHHQVPYVIVSQNGYKEVWACGLGTIHDSIAIERSAVDAFDQMHQILNSVGMSFNQVVRQWNYIANILDFDIRGSSKYQHYQIFNEVRNQYYRRYRTVEGYPAATGIGSGAGGVSIDFCAVDAVDHTRIVSIDNPLQCSPYRYSQALLEGEVLQGTEFKQAPQFERAKLVSTSAHSSLYVSGTASIIGEKTIGEGDVKAQTLTTIDHIRQLVCHDNLQNHDRSIPFNPPTVKALRVYVKESRDFHVIECICREAFGAVPMMFVKADVCRNNLLVEIEAEYGV